MGQRRKISGSLILITGASQGIGKALAEAAARRGGKVLAAARSDELLRQMSDHVRSQGGILETWDVEYFPTIYVLDHKGVIRYKDVRGEDMDEAVDALLAEMRAKK